MALPSSALLRHASASRPPRRATSTSAASAPRSSTGSGPESTGGTFVLRIEDTDQERSTDESRRVILDAHALARPRLGRGARGRRPPRPLLPDGAAPASTRSSPRRSSAQKRAYRCYCTKEELDAQREALKAKDPKAQFRYPGTCRDRTDQPDRPFVVRFRAPSRARSPTTTSSSARSRRRTAAQQDFVLVRSDGVPLYNFGAVVDDITMGITLVSRGRDHMVNTPPQILLYEALGYRRPRVRPPADDARAKRREALEAPRRGQRR